MARSPRPPSRARRPARASVLTTLALGLLAACGDPTGAATDGVSGVDAADVALPDSTADDVALPDSTADDVALLDSSTADDVAPLDSAADDDSALSDSGHAEDSTSDATLSCGLPIAGSLTVPFGPVTAEISGASAVAEAGCSVEVEGPDHIYAVDITQPTLVRFTVEASNLVTISLRGVCDDLASELACEASLDPGGNALDADLAPGTYYLILDTPFDPGGGYTLRGELLEPVANGTCDAASPLASGSPLAGQSFDGADEATLPCPSSPVDRPTVWYQLTIPARSRAYLTPGSPAGTFVSDCGPQAECLGGDGYANLDDAPRSVWLAVPKPAIWMGAFDIGVSYEPLGTAPSCEEPPSLSPGVAAEVELATVAEVPQCYSGYHRGVFHAITVPANTLLRAWATPDNALPFPHVTILEGCTASECLARSAGPGWPAEYANRSDAPRDLRVMTSLSIYDEGGEQVYALNGELTPLADHRFCAAAVPLEAGVSVSSNSRLGGEPLACGGPQDWTVLEPLYYAIDVPPGKTLRWSARSTGRSRMAVAMLSSCEAPTCLATSAGRPASMVHTNTGAATEHLILVVGRFQFDAAGGPFDLATRLADPPSNMVCANATPLGDGALLPAEDVRDGVDSLAAACAPASGGGVLYYRVTVPAGEELVAVAAPAPVWGVGGWAPLLRLLDGCGAASCVDYAPVGFIQQGDPVRLAWRNAGAEPVERVLTVSVDHGDVPNHFDLEVDTRTPLYVVDEVPTACEDLLAVPWRTFADDYTPTEALPFTMPYFGVPVTHFTPSRNGHIRLWTEGGNLGEVDVNGPRSLPFAYNFPGMVAAYWDGTSFKVRTQTLGAGDTSRLVVEWSRTSGGNIVAQAILRPSGEIQLHYCTLTLTGGELPGATATVGLQDLTASDAMLIGFKRPNAVSAAHAIRFTPY